jgi:hypothetical protein
VKSVCQSWFGAVVLSLNSSAAFITMKAGLVISRNEQNTVRYLTRHEVLLSLIRGLLSRPRASRNDTT